MCNSGRSNSQEDSSIDIVSSTDHPFAISDTLKKCLQETKESLLISSPYVSKSYFDRIRGLPKGTIVNFLTRVPKEHDHRTFRTIESLFDIARLLGLKTSVKCRPDLFHPKFVVYDNRIVTSGSVNYTSSGMYDNDEILYVFKHPAQVKRHIEIFDGLWNCPRNITWENIRLFFGHKGDNNRNFINKQIAEAIIEFFHLNGNKQTHEEVLVRKIVHKNFNRKDVVEVINNLVRDGVLFRPEPSYLKLVEYQTDIQDF